MSTRNLELSPVTLAVLSDTHGHLAYLNEALGMLEAFAPALILHCGDIGSPEIIERLAPWPTHYVFGNCDVDLPALRATMERVGHVCHERRGQLDVAGRRIAFVHGDDAADLHTAIHSGAFDLVCHGHTHQRRIEQHGATRVLNPGALYRATPHSLAIVTLPTLEIESIVV